jgi:purine nucleoside phosphorylase
MRKVQTVIQLTSAGGSQAHAKPQDGVIDAEYVDVDERKSA